MAGEVPKEVSFSRPKVGEEIKKRGEGRRLRPSQSVTAGEAPADTLSARVDASGTTALIEKVMFGL